MTDTSKQLLDPGRDAGQIEYADWAVRELPGGVAGRRAGFQVVIAAEALERIHRQGQSNLKQEVGGVLVGERYQDEQGPYLWIKAIIEGRSMHHHAAQVTFTAETWADIQQTMDEEYPDDRIVGWYHTHPGFGIFLSEMDLFIQDNFFNLPWQTALVYDPKSGEEGAFIWRNGRAVQEKFLVAGSKAEEAPPAEPEPGEAGPIAEAFPATSFEELAGRQLEMERRLRVLSRESAREIEALRRRNRWLTVGLLFVLSFTVAWSMVVVTLLPRPPVGPPAAAPATRPI